MPQLGLDGSTREEEEPAIYRGSVICDGGSGLGTADPELPESGAEGAGVEVEDLRRAPVSLDLPAHLLQDP